MNKFKGKVSGWQIGRESSPVIYVRLPHWTHQRECQDNIKQQRISDIDNKKLIKTLKEQFIGVCYANEFDTEKYNDRVVRIWWD